MIVTVVVALAAAGFLATFVVDRRRRRRLRRLAETTTAESRATRTDGLANPIAAEGVHRASSPPLDGWY